MNIIEAVKEAQKGKEIYRRKAAENGTLRYLHLWDMNEDRSWRRNFGRFILGTRGNTDILLSDEDLLAEDWEAVNCGTRKVK